MANNYWEQIRLLPATSGFQAEELFAIVGVAGASRVGGFDQRALQVRVASQAAAGLSLASRFIIAWTDSHPGRQFRGRLENCHINTKFGHDDCGNLLVHSGDLVQ